MDRQRNGWDFVIDVMNGMGRGLFASLIVGLILRQAGAYLSVPLLTKLGSAAQILMGPAIAASIACSVSALFLAVFSSLTGTLSGEISAAVESDPHLRLEHREQPHITAALNQCIRSSEADVAIMLDDDARPCPGWLEAFEAAFAAYPDAPYIMGREIRTRCHGLGGLLARGLLEAMCRPFAPAEALSAGRLVGWINGAGLLLGNFDLPGDRKAHV